MNGGVELVLSPETLLRIFVAMLYIPAGLLAFRRIMPALSRPAKLLACILLALQLLLIVVAIEQQSESGFAFWLWHLDLEWNIPSIFSSAQLALIGGLALATAWAYREGGVVQRVYFAALAVIFIILGLEEFFAWKESITETAWRMNYFILGAAVIIVTTLVTAYSPKDERGPLIILLFGLAIMAIGGGIIDMLPEVCGDIGILRLDGCFYFYRSPEEIVEILGAWVVLLALLCRLSRGRATLSPRGWWLLHFFPLVWILLLVRYSPVNSFEVQPPAQRASVLFESNAQLHGFQTDGRGLPAIAFMFLPYDIELEQLGFSVHLVDQVSGESVASREVYAHRRYAVWPGGRGYEPVYAQAIDLHIPPAAPVNRALWIVLTHWRETGGQFLPQAVDASDLRLLNETQVVLGELALRAEATRSTSSPIAVFENGFTLNQVQIPERAQAGSTVNFSFDWETERHGREDYSQFLHFVPASPSEAGEAGASENGQWWGFDQLPLGARLPTRLWYSGLQDGETWEVPIPADVAAGKYALFTGLYRLSDLVRLEASDKNGRPYVDDRVPLGFLMIHR
ncbi:MAG: hypothetical protein OXG53_03390 [Chloroflexi bacterium]|nr:hypothetical protein [Chloroflexota bacterium]